MAAAPLKRVYKRLPVWVVEDHHDVLPFLYRSMGSKHLPMEDLRMLHLDSHPDLLLPVDLQAHTVFNRLELLQQLSIENWILPLVFAGHMTSLAWLHPSWSQQITEGEHRFTVGRDASTSTIRVSSRENYFLSDALYVNAEHLEDPRPLSLSVITVRPVTGSEPRTDGGCSAKRLRSDQSEESSSQTVTAAEGAITEGEGPEGEGPEGSTSYIINRLSSFLNESESYILDIDLDFFSCKNPFKELYTQEEYSILKELYSFSPPTQSATEEELEECVRRRTHQLEDLEAAFADLLEDDGDETVTRWTKHPRMASLAPLVASLKHRTQSPDYEMVHQAGLTCDVTELPHHVSSEEEIDELMEAVHRVLKHLPAPTVITMSRSSLDEYCPLEQVENIQDRMVRVLEKLYGDVDVHREYEHSSTETHTTETHTV